MVSIETVGASGAYYVASASDKIYADSGSIVGSIGVIARVGELWRSAQVGQAEKMSYIKTGEFKDTGNPARDLTPNEQAYMQSLIDNMFGQFVHAVADGRGMKYRRREVDRQRQRCGPASRRCSMKLIDGVGDFETAVTDTAKSVGI